MKIKYSIYILSLLLFTNCNQPKTTSTDVAKDSLAKQIDTARNVDTKKVNKSSNAIHYQLDPIEILDSANTNVYEKYGIEFSGNCYSCDLAQISFGNKNTLTLKNICSEELINFSYSSIQITDKQIQISCAKQEFIFTKIEEVPIYKLEIKGEQLDLKNKRIVEYYTPSELIKKFAEHDCGDFQG